FFVFLGFKFLQPDPIPRIEPAHSAPAALAKGRVDAAVYPNLAVIVHGRLEPDGAAVRWPAIHPVRDGDFDSIPAPTLLAGPARLAERLRLNDFPLGVVELAVRLRLNLVVLRARTGHNLVVAPLSFCLGHALSRHQVNGADHSLLRGGRPWRDQEGEDRQNDQEASVQALSKHFLNPFSADHVISAGGLRVPNCATDATNKRRLLGYAGLSP